MKHKKIFYATVILLLGTVLILVGAIFKISNYNLMDINNDVFIGLGLIFEMLGVLLLVIDLRKKQLQNKTTS